MNRRATAPVPPPRIIFEERDKEGNPSMLVPECADGAPRELGSPGVEASERGWIATKYTFNWFLGVFVPVFVNVVCVTYFMDLHRAVSQIGWGYSLLFYFISFILSAGTLTSICVIATNGEMRDGGCYYLISRTLGPEIGAALGITLIIAHATAISWRLHYIAAAITQMYSGPVTTSAKWDRTVWRVCLSVLVFLMCVPGAKLSIYILVVCFVLICIALLVLFIGFFARKPGSVRLFTGMSMDNIHRNFGTHITETADLIVYLGILFPASNALMTCANFGGRLKNASRAIPIGGFAAILTSTVAMFATILFSAAVFAFEEQDYSTVSFLLIESAIYPPLAYAGFIAACLGSALTLNIGGARILNVMVYDELLPGFLKKWVFRGEPLLSHFIVTLISLAFAVVDEPTTSTKITNVIFLVPFCLVNWAVWTAASAHYPGFRPSFRFYNRWIALVMAVLCFARMWVVNWIISLIVLPVFIIIWVIYKCLKPEDRWGTVTQSMTFYKTLKEELNLYHIKPHVKTYRPNVIFITKAHPDDRRTFSYFLNEVLHGHGMAAIGRVVISDEDKDFQGLVEERDGTYLTSDEGYRIFYDITIASSFAEGVRDLILLMGIGMMRPNTLCLEYPETWADEETTELNDTDFVSSVKLAFDASYGVLIIRHLDLFMDVDRAGNIDVWFLDDDGGLTLLPPYLLRAHRRWKHAHFRVLTVAFLDEGETYDEKQKNLATMLYRYRINGDGIVIEGSVEHDSITPFTKMNWDALARQFQLETAESASRRTKRYLVIADILRQYSSHASFIALTQDIPPADVDSKLYMAWLETVSKINVPFCFIRGNGDNVLSWKV